MLWGCPIRTSYQASPPQSKLEIDQNQNNLFLGCRLFLKIRACPTVRDFALNSEEDCQGCFPRKHRILKDTLRILGKFQRPSCWIWRFKLGFAPDSYAWSSTCLLLWLESVTEYPDSGSSSPSPWVRAPIWCSSETGTVHKSTLKTWIQESTIPSVQPRRPNAAVLKPKHFF